MCSSLQRTSVCSLNDCMIQNGWIVGLCPDWEDWDPNENLQNATEAMKLAEDWLSVPPVGTDSHRHRHKSKITRLPDS